MRYPVRYFKVPHVLGLDRDSGNNVEETRHIFRVGDVEIDLTYIDKRRWRPIIQQLRETKQ